MVVVKRHLPGSSWLMGVHMASVVAACLLRTCPSQGCLHSKDWLWQEDEGPAFGLTPSLPRSGLSKLQSSDQVKAFQGVIAVCCLLPLPKPAAALFLP